MVITLAGASTVVGFECVLPSTSVELVPSSLPVHRMIPLIRMEFEEFCFDDVRKKE